MTYEIGTGRFNDGEFLCRGEGHAELDTLEDFTFVSVIDVHVLDADDLFVGKKTAVFFGKKGA